MVFVQKKHNRNTEQIKNTDIQLGTYKGIVFYVYRHFLYVFGYYLDIYKNGFQPKTDINYVI
jgi:hypothetical protein